jgi:hypothetical protein
MEIAMAYVKATGLAERFINPECLVATGINYAWRSGVTHQIALANAGIVFAERTAKVGSVPSVFPRVI